MGSGARPVLPALTLDQLVSRQVRVPDVVQVRRVPHATGPPLDVAAVVREQLALPLRVVRPGDTVAVGVGSRGITRIADVVRAVVGEIRAVGGSPYLVPAMGSHGSVSAAGQTAVLADLGITDEIAPVRASMDTLPLGRASDVDVHLSTEAAAADHLIVVNRLKSHTSFTGRIESGLAKMVAIGLGKQRGAQELHRLGPLQLERRILAAYALIASEVPLLGGLAVTEGAGKTLLSLDFVPPDGIGADHEADLLRRAKDQEARLPFPRIDVLVVDRMGKELSGTGLDTNVIGRRMVRGSPEPDGPDVTNVVVLGVTPASEGNAVGLGLADFVPVAALDGVDLATTYMNALTAGLQGVQRAQIPIALATERDAVTAALMTAGVPDPADARIVRIRSTLALDDLMVTPNLLEHLAPHEAPGEPHPLFADDRLAPWVAPGPERGSLR